MPRAFPVRANQELRIGSRLRAARRARSMTISQLAEDSGLSQGFISVLERDGASASVATLFRICNALDISLGSLFEPPRTKLIRKKDRLRANFGGYGIEDFLLTPGNERSLQVIESRIAAGGGSGDEEHSFDADAELVYVLKGALEFHLGEKQYRLDAGDALTLSPREPHRWRNPSTRAGCTVLWIITPAAL
jgi:transcriptional regulator with XRE-family HTH domain